MGFDRISSINSSDSGSSGSSGGLGSGDGFDYSKLMNSALAGLNDLADKATDSFIDRMRDKVKNAFDEFKNKLKTRLTELTGITDFTFGFDKDKAKASLKNIINDIKSTFKNIGVLTLQLGIKITDDLQVGKILNKVLDLADAFSHLAKVVSDVLGPVLNDLYDNYLSPLVNILGQAIINKLEGMAKTVREFANYIKILNKENKNIGDIEFLKQFREQHPVLTAVANTLGKILQTVKDLAKYLNNLFTGTGTEEELAKFREGHPVLTSIIDALGKAVNTGKLKDGLVGLFVGGDNTSGEEMSKNALTGGWWW